MLLFVAMFAPALPSVPTNADGTWRVLASCQIAEYEIEKKRRNLHSGGCISVGSFHK
jgi:hypothetical protein